MNSSLTNLDLLLPEWIVCGTILVLILAHLMGTRSRRELTEYTALGLLLSLLTLILTIDAHRILSRALIGNGLLQVDVFSQFSKLLFLGSTLVAVLFSAGSVEISQRRTMEYNCFLLGVCSGMMFLASSLDLMMVYLSFEMMSLSSYILAGFIKGDPRSSEAGYKYVLFGAVSSGIMLFGMSFLYGMTGSTNLMEIGFRMNHGLVQSAHLVFLPVLFIMVGLGYKIAFFPFHYWAPDVYEGSPTPVTAFFSVGTKAAGFILALRIVYGTFDFAGGDLAQWLGPLLALVAALTMTLGNLAALNQSNIKRMLAYSAIAHAGYMLMGLSVMTEDGARAVLFYLFAYLFMNLGAFTVVIALFNLYQNEQVDEMTGIGRMFPLAAASMAVCLFSLTGLPPTAGFIGKFYVFAAVIDRGYYTLAFIGALNTVISLFYYMRILKAFYFQEPRAGTTDTEGLGCGYNVLIASLTAPILIFGVCWQRLFDYCSNSITMLVSH